MTYEFRKLNATDIFPMIRIIKAIGVNKFAACFETESAKKILESISDGTGDVKVVGAAVMLEFAQVILDGLDKVEEDIYKLLARVSTLSVEEIKGLEIGDFIEMIVEFVKKEEFRDFFMRAQALLKPENSSSETSSLSDTEDLGISLMS